jgi:hypothetical protein
MQLLVRLWNTLRDNRFVPAAVMVS